jgi:heme-degrading monooxygenase HmoA
LLIPPIDTVGVVLIKWVRCQVTDPVAFDRGQRGWGSLARLPGFLGQCGGWSEPGVAHVLAFWRSAADHAAFLAGPHDELARAQRDSYGRIDVRLFEQELTPGDGAVVRIEQREELLRLSWWRSVQDHDRHQAGGVIAELVALEPSWAVPPAV